MNTAFIATGVLLMPGAGLTWNGWPRRRLTTASLVCIALAGIGYMLVGLGLENVNVRVHVLGASNLLTSNVGLLLLGLSTRAERSWRSTLALSLAGVALVGLVGGLVLVAVLQHGGGLSERLVLYPCVIYVIVVGACLFRYARNHDGLDWPAWVAFNKGSGQSRVATSGSGTRRKSDAQGIGEFTDGLLVDAKIRRNGRQDAPRIDDSRVVSFRYLRRRPVAEHVDRRMRTTE